MNFIFVSICMLNKKNKILITKRPSHKFFGGFWEFPGGKLEKKETFKEAMQRELFEELGVRASSKHLRSIDVFNHTYDKKNYIVMNLFYLKKWKGLITNKDNERFLWVNKTGPFPNKFLGGGLIILKRLKNQYYKL